MAPFGSPHPPKIKPSWSHNGSKSFQTSIKKMITFWIVSGLIFERFWAPTWGVQWGPLGVRWGSVGRLFGLLKLSWSQDDPKSPPRSPKTPPRGLLGAILTIWGSTLMVFLTNLKDFRPPTWWILQLTNQLKKQSTNQPSNQRAQEAIHPDIPTSLGPGAGGPKALGSAAPAGVQGVFKIACQILPTTRSYSLTITDRPLWSITS